MKTNYHTHPTHCQHATGSDEETLRKLGIKVIDRIPFLNEK